MGIVFRQSVKTTIVIATGAILGAAITYISSLALSKQEFGFLTNFINLGAILQLIILLGTGALIQVYTQKYAVDDVRRKALITFSAVVSIFAILLFTVGYYFLKEQIISRYQAHDRELLETYFGWLPVLITIWGFMSLFDLYLVSQSKVAISTFMREVLLRICNLVLIVLYFYDVLSFHYLLLGSILVYIIPAGIIFLIAARTKGFGFSLNFRAFSKSEYKELLHFSWYHLLLSVSHNFLGYIDSIMLAPLDKSGMESLAGYRWAIFIAAIMVIPYRAMSTASFVPLNQAYIDGDKPKLSDLFRRSGVNILIVGVGMFVMIAVNLDNVVRILPKGYEVVKPLVLILMLGRLFDMATGVNNEVISISKYYKFNFRLSVLLLLMIIALNRVTIPQFGVYGAAWSTALSLILFNIAKTIFLWKKMRLSPFTAGSYWIIIGGVLCIAIGYAIPYMGNPFIDAFCRTLIVAISYLLCLLKFKPSPDLNAYLTSVRQTKRLF